MDVPPRFPAPLHPMGRATTCLSSPSRTGYTGVSTLDMRVLIVSKSSVERKEAQV